MNDWVESVELRDRGADSARGKMTDATAQLKEEDLVAALGAVGGGSLSEAGAAADATSPDAGSQRPETLVSTADFAAALAEIESSGPAGHGASSVDGEAREAGDDAVGAHPPSQSAATPEPQPESVAPTATTPEASNATLASAAAEPAQPAAESAQPAGEPPHALKFTIGRKGSGTAPTVAPAAPAALASAPVAAPIAEFAEAAQDEALELPKLGLAVRLGKRTIRLAEAALDSVHKPIARFSPGLLRAIGVWALTTIGVSALSIVALPVLFPARDAISYLNERVAALDSPKAAASEADGEAHGAEKANVPPHGDGPAAEKPKAKTGEAKPKTSSDAHAAKKPADKKPAGAHH